MIVVKLELWPAGDKSQAIDLGTAEICNRSNLDDISTYSIRLLKGAAYSKFPGEEWRSATVAQFPRFDQRWGPWELLALGLEEAIGDRAKRLRDYLASIQDDGRLKRELIGGSNGAN